MTDTVETATRETTTRFWNGTAIPTAGTFALDPAHTRVGFVARHLMVSKVRGAFTKVSGDVVIGADPAESTVNAVIPAESIDTGVADRDAHLRGPDFLDAEAFPALTFRSTGLVLDRADTFTLRGELTVRNVT